MKMHQCPAPGCTKKVGYFYLMCPYHWRQVASDIQQRVWKAWNGGKGVGTPEHEAARQAAIDSLKPKE